MQNTLFPSKYIPFSFSHQLLFYPSAEQRDHQRDYPKSLPIESAIPLENKRHLTISLEIELVYRPPLLLETNKSFKITVFSSFKSYNFISQSFFPPSLIQFISSILAKKRYIN